MKKPRLLIICADDRIGAMVPFNDGKNKMGQAFLDVWHVSFNLCVYRNKTGNE